jgi:hypothetical protein
MEDLKMAESLEKDRHGIEIWTRENIIKDLETQGGLKGVLINQQDYHCNSYNGITLKGTKFYTTWMHDLFFKLSTSRKEQILLDAFNKILGYRYFCYYLDYNGTMTYEWDKVNPDERLIHIARTSDPAKPRKVHLAIR